MKLSDINEGLLGSREVVKTCLSSDRTRPGRGGSGFSPDASSSFNDCQIAPKGSLSPPILCQMIAMCYPRASPKMYVGVRLVDKEMG